jgi:uncharacterized protein (TIGR03067 family)
MIRFAVASVAVLVGLGVVLAEDNDLKALQGSYKLESLSIMGKDAPAEIVANTTVKITGDELAIAIKDTTKTAKIKIDPKAKPAHIDISPSDGPEKGKTFPGIYKIEKGELVIAFTEKGDRPTDFKGEGDVGVLRLKRTEK